MFEEVDVTVECMIVFCPHFLQADSVIGEWYSRSNSDNSFMHTGFKGEKQTSYNRGRYLRVFVFCYFRIAVQCNSYTKIATTVSDY